MVGVRTGEIGLIAEPLLELSRSLTEMAERRGEEVGVVCMVGRLIL